MYRLLYTRCDRGASFTALYYVALKMARNEECYIMRQFFKAFKENFKRSTLIWCCVLVLILFFAADFRLIYSMTISDGLDGNIGILFMIALGIIFIFFAFTLSFIFPLVARFENTALNLVKSAFVLSIRHFPTTIAVLVLHLILPLLIFLGLLKWALPLFCFFGFSLSAYLNSFMLLKIFEKYS